jgi:hypothetical protein
LVEVATVTVVVRAQRTAPRDFSNLSKERVKAALQAWLRGSGNYNIGLKIKNLHDYLRRL